MSSRLSRFRGRLRPVSYQGRVFSDAEDFSATTFHWPVRFNDVTFGTQGVSFAQAEFHAAVRFEDAVFAGPCEFGRATFRGPVTFERVTFHSLASFDGATFEAEVDFVEVTCRHAARFRDTHFNDALTTERFEVWGVADFESARVRGRARLAIAAAGVSLRSAQFGGELTVDAHWAEVAMDRAELAGPTTIGPGPAAWNPSQGLRDASTGAPPDALESERRHARTAAPRLLSLRGVSGRNLSLTGVDLRACRFDGCREIEAMRLDMCTFPRAPRWSRRATVADEHAWRRAPGRRLRAFSSRGWMPPETRPPSWLPVPVDPSPATVASIYRALRKGREDAKDEPGGSDFYFGEMEMRRHTRDSCTLGTRFTSWWERLTLTLYWLLSGYALRPSRAAIALVSVVALFTVLFALYGFQRPANPFADAGASVKSATGRPLPSTPTLRARRPAPFPPSIAVMVDALDNPDAWTYSWGTATAVIGAPEAAVTDWGRAFRVVLRVLGPLFLGLVLVSIRGRVKRN